MEDLYAFYKRLLHFGLMILRDAIYANNVDWAKAEVEMLHNIPSLIGEQNLKRHRYFWFSERTSYIEKIDAMDLDYPKSRMLVFYEPIWQEMEPVLLALLRQSVPGSDSGDTLRSSQ